jgi:hypothetical protein
MVILTAVVGLCALSTLLQLMIKKRVVATDSVTPYFSKKNSIL